MAKALFTFLQSNGGLSSFTASACLWMLGNASDVIGDIPHSAHATTASLPVLFIHKDKRPVEKPLFSPCYLFAC